MTMKAVVVHEFGESLDRLHVSNISRPRAKDDEILVKVVAAGINFVDILYVRGSSSGLTIPNHPI